MKKHLEELVYRIEGDYALAKEECDEDRQAELRAAIKLARGYFARSIGVCREFARARKF